MRWLRWLRAAAPAALAALAAPAASPAFNILFIGLLGPHTAYSTSNWSSGCAGCVGCAQLHQLRWLRWLRLLRHLRSIYCSLGFWGPILPIVLRIGALDALPEIGPAARSCVDGTDARSCVFKTVTFTQKYGVSLIASALHTRTFTRLGSLFAFCFVLVYRLWRI